MNNANPEFPPWLIRKSINGVLTRNVQEVYRYMDQVFIDQFFNDGTIKLSSFQSNREKENDIRKDENEGFRTFKIISRDRKRQYDLTVDDRDTHRMLCTSVDLDLDNLNTRFGGGCFKITNTFAFSMAIARKLELFERGQEGLVQYSDNNYTPIFLETIPHLPDLTDGDFSQITRYIDFISRNQFEMFFHKETVFFY
jgi:hypothetical protein